MGVIPQPVPTTYTEGNCIAYSAVSEVFTFNVVPDCTRGFTQYQLMFKNRYGHWDYYQFLAAKSEGLSIDRQNFKTWNVDWGSSNPNKTQYSRGLTTFNTTMTETHVINSGFINEPDFVFLEELYTSDEVFEITEDGGLRAIVITNAEFIRKNRGNRNIFNLELSYVYANNISLISK
jgi:hypothetical protein